MAENTTQSAQPPFTKGHIALGCSHRLPAHFHANALTQALRDLKARGTRYLDLTVSNPTRCGFEYPEVAIRQALAEGPLFHYSPDPTGPFPVREAIAAWHGGRVSPDDLLLCASTSEAYGWLFKLLGNPGDRFLTATPGYPLCEWLARLEGVQLDTVPAYHTDRWHLDVDALASACTARTRALLLVNPNNPTGQFVSRHEWQALLALCERQKMALIVDEVFADYALETPPDALRTALDETKPPCPLFVLSGLSKIAAMPQVKLGWIAAKGPQAKALWEPLTFLADQYLSVSIGALAMAPCVLTHAPILQQQIITRLQHHLALLDEQLRPYPSLSRLPVEGGWSVLLRRPAIESDEAAALRLLHEARVLVQPGHYFDMPSEGYLVLSLLGPTDPWREGLERALPCLAKI